MKTYDAIVIGSGSGALVVQQAVEHGLKVALVDKGPAGGTCLNTGCIPSKMLIYPADRIVEIQEAGKLGVSAAVQDVDFAAIMERMRRITGGERDEIRQALLNSENPRFYEGEGRFVGEKTIEVNGEKITAKQIFIASGARPVVPPPQGLDRVDYLTNESLLQLEECPDSLVIMGGGYIAVEYGHFFAAMGARVTILEMAGGLVMSEEPEISDLIEKQLGARIDIHTNTEVLGVRKNGKLVSVSARDKTSGATRDFAAEKLLVAVGRRPNSDLLGIDRAGIEIDKRGFIKVNDGMETTQKNVYAIGDANGRHMFTHSANRMAMVAAQNGLHNAKMKFDAGAAPHAVFSHPQIASVGLTARAAAGSHQILVGATRYSEVARGEAMMETAGFAKAVVEKDSGKILGFHVIGPYAPKIIQEVVNAISSGGHVNDIGGGIHIHPAMSELIPATLNNLGEVGETGSDR